jgi:hypothetical protein
MRQAAVFRINKRPEKEIGECLMESMLTLGPLTSFTVEAWRKTKELTTHEQNASVMCRI